jgi:hypothetical protein
LRAELLEEHEPQSVLECELVERLAGILWRLRRVPFFEAAIIDARQVDAAEFARRSPSRCDDAEQDDDDEMSDEELSAHVGGALIHDSTYGDGLGKLARHETTLMNAVAKTLQMLFLLQGSRSHNEGDAVVIEATALPRGRGEGSIAA